VCLKEGEIRAIEQAETEDRSLENAVHDILRVDARLEICRRILSKRIKSPRMRRQMPVSAVDALQYVQKENQTAFFDSRTANLVEIGRVAPCTTFEYVSSY
jgi:hypothetical protein